ncbi:MAG: hypothetical protein ABI270_02080 [Nitrosospira sp.]
MDRMSRYLQSTKLRETILYGRPRRYPMHCNARHRDDELGWRAARKGNADIDLQVNQES